MDQLVALHNANRRLRWHVKVILHFSRIALANAYITWRDVQRDFDKKKQNNKGGVLGFIMALVEEIKHSQAPTTPSSVHTASRV